MVKQPLLPELTLSVVTKAPRNSTPPTLALLPLSSLTLPTRIPYTAPSPCNVIIPVTLSLPFEIEHLKLIPRTSNIH